MAVLIDSHDNVQYPIQRSGKLAGLWRNRLQILMHKFRQPNLAIFMEFVFSHANSVTGCNCCCAFLL